jgi:hypothetical protein
MGAGGGSTPVQETPAKAIERVRPVAPEDIIMGEHTPEEEAIVQMGKRALVRPLGAPTTLTIN